MRCVNILCVCVLAFLLASCGGAGTPVTSDTSVADAFGDQEVPPGDAVEADGRAPVDAADAGDVGGDLGDEEAADFLPPDGAPCTGQWLCPCQQGSDCDSGYCIETMDGKVCTESCAEECPAAGWLCVQDAASAPDYVYICVPPHGRLCLPCTGSEQCYPVGLDNGDRCVAMGNAGAFCGGACGNSDCPSGYSCKEVESIEGAASKQCVPDAGVCECGKYAVEHAAKTQCANTNDAGSCPGWRKCTEEGLTACDAAVPEAEKCDALDNDCDAVTDEDLGSTTCGFGECEHVVENCPDGVQVLCDPYQGAVPEGCDGKDNDCDGEKDEGFPDADEDGLPDCLETDKDGDDIPDYQDNCEYGFNPDQKDFDLDTIGDVCDPDDDNDLAADEDDCAALDPAVYPGAVESCNGKDDDCNLVIDEGFADTDADGWKDCVDTDDDNDSALDAADCLPLDATVFPGAAEACNGKDDDCDFDVDEGFADLDDDGQADCTDLDDDGDGVPDAVDNCTTVLNADQADLDGDTLGDACDPDADGDSIPDAVDNCKGLKNTLQADTDMDGLGDECDPDLDGDGKDNAQDNCPLVANPGQEDTDGDGMGDACEEDKDGDGTPDALDCAPLDPAIHPAAAEACNGVDDNCNQAIDEGFADLDADGLKNCVDPDDDGDNDPDDLDCAPLDPKVHHDAAEVCNGMDDDCNGLKDEGLGTASCGKGLCTHTVPVCKDGKVNVCDPMQGAAQEECDGLDNDCNGLVDEGLGFETCGQGSCFHVVPKCTGGELTECDPMQGAAAESCDGKDNDCDGELDEELGDLACGKGACFHTVPACLNGKINSCDPLQGALAEVCDGKDNDCDGLADEDLGSTTCGKGECNHTQANCAAGQPQLCDPMEGAATEQCDGKDNDCNGLVDEGLGTTTCGKGECLHTVANCVNGQAGACDPMLGAADETCDGLDNDCDGPADEQLGSTTCGVGLCLHTVLNCVNGEPQTCDPLQGALPESCNGKDDDCDGEADEELGTSTCGKGVCAHPVDNCTAGKPGECNPLEGAGAETCNALDDDCDGGTDEDHANTCCLNGILTAAEECDDGNQVGNDGCSLICTLPGCRGLQLDGKDDKVVISPDPTLESPNAFTWEVWVYFTGHRDGDAQSIIADYGQDGYGCGLQAYDYGGSHYHTFEIACGHGYSWSPWAWTSMKYTTQTWYHLAMTYDGNGVSLYVNGELQFTAAGTVTPTASQPLLLGARNNGGDPNWVLGIIDDVRIWNHARTKDQIQANMKAVLSGSEAGLIAYYRMDQQNGGQKMLDYTTKAHTGTLGNAAGADGQDPIWVNVTSPQQGCGL